MDEDGTPHTAMSRGRLIPDGTIAQRTDKLERILSNGRAGIHRLCVAAPRVRYVCVDHQSMRVLARSDRFVSSACPQHRTAAATHTTRRTNRSIHPFQCSFHCAGQCALIESANVVMCAATVAFATSMTSPQTVLEQYTLHMNCPHKATRRDLWRGTQISILHCPAD